MAGVSLSVRCTKCSSGGFGGLPRGLFGSSMPRTVAPIFEDSNNPCSPDLSDYNKSPSTEVYMIAGEVFMQPEEGALRLVVGKVYAALDDTSRPGIVVQEYAPMIDKDGFELVSCHWVDVCPLTDAHLSLHHWNEPVCWREASRDLRVLIEAGQPVTLDTEWAALLKHSPKGVPTYAEPIYG
jgi:hypothetical protein